VRFGVVVLVFDNQQSSWLHGCSLKIHRVEISVADGKRTVVKVGAHRAISNILIASTNIQFDSKLDTA